MAGGVKTAFIIGGTGQIGAATARRLAEHGWSVMIAHRGAHEGDSMLTDLDVTTVRLDRNDTETLIPLADGHDLVLDAVAYEPRHAQQLAQLAGLVGSLVVISTGAVYQDADGRSLDTATSEDAMPRFPDPIDESQPTVTEGAPTYGVLKARLERTLLDADELPVSILRPGAVHGPFSVALREWYFVKRARDHREQAVLAYDGTSRFSPTSTAAIAELARLCAEVPAKRVLNVADDDVTVADIANAVFDAMGHSVELVPVPGAPARGVGSTPWSTPHPIVLSTRRAEDELGYTAPAPYRTAVHDDVEWIVDVVNGANRRQTSWRALFPHLVRRYGADAWFDYEAEDEFLAHR
ncbi:NAD(P)H-binding protein [Planctomonas sp. JC2975]|uniref:NAD-dependent epimerase/dehydratase family protein n=1 Tax=Planctomonas sp. JC2975 TaxID=2729626 RepID=UPI001475044C|nr:NAD-dependent epimerase/dehydratase family protein [Planctomonas sp. JC2975]NNC12666.1 NAD(P)H-binding protein [Planctomonas sp. JC2975]